MSPAPLLYRLRPLCLGAALVAALAGCGRDGAEPAAPTLHASTGQVKPVAVNPVSRYAASRFADQVSFGANKALVDDIASKGFAAWIDAQFALPVKPVDATPVKFDTPETWRYVHRTFYQEAIGGSDQLRQRVNFALSQIVVVSIRKVNGYGGLLYYNLLSEHAFGNYGALIQAISTSPAMGEYLDNIQNRPTSPQCPSCAPNENYARELMQLFTLGVVKLNLDGSVQRDANRMPIETYTQKDVQELARALTGWNYSVEGYGTSQARYEGKLVPDSWEPTHDRGAKLLLGSTIASGGDASRDLEAAVAILMAHPNVAPFVSLRLIQHLVTSNPSPAYISRVATVFNNNGSGVRGDMKAVIKAILLDAEARRGDQIGAGLTSAGKMREPYLWYMGLLRGLDCKRPLEWEPGNLASPSQIPLTADSVFSYYAATDRAPGSNLLAPEQRLLNASEFASRLGGLSIHNESRAADAGCDTAPYARALTTSPAAFADLVSERFFRGAMPVVLRQNLIDLAPVIWGDSNHAKAMSLLLYALASPYHGVIR